MTIPIEIIGAGGGGGKDGGGGGGQSRTPVEAQTIYFQLPLQRLYLPFQKVKLKAFLPVQKKTFS